MSIFGTQSDFGLDVPAMESYSIYGGDFVALEEAMTDMQGVIESIHTHDMAELQCEKEVRALEASYASAYEIESVRENYAVVMEGAVKDMYEKLINMLKKLWAKIKGYFANMVRFFDGLTKSGKDFVKKYEKQLQELDLAGFEYPMYKWDNARLSNDTNVEDYPNLVQKVIRPYVAEGGATAEAHATKAKTLADKKEEILDKVRGAFVGKGSVEAADFNEALFGYFRNGATGKDDRDDVKVNISAIIATLKEDKMVAKLKKAEANVNKVFNEQIKELTKQRDALNKNVVAQGGDSEKGSIAKAAANYHNRKISIFTEAQSIALGFVRAWKDAVVARNKEYKAVAVAAFRYKAEK